MNEDEKRFEALTNEIVALTTAMEYALSAIIAASPDREGILLHLTQYRRQVVGSRDQTKAAISQHLQRLDDAVRLLPEDFP